MRRPRLLVVYSSDKVNATLSYQTGWPQGFERHAGIRATLANLAATSRGARARVDRLLRSHRFDAVVLLHSVFSNGPALNGPRLESMRKNTLPKALFLGNEYKLMPEKMEFAEGLGIELLVSQLDAEEARGLYRKRLGCAVVDIPSAGWDPELFRPAPGLEPRPIDLGYRAYESPWYLGHRERHAIAEAFEEAARRRGLRADISLNPESRMDARGWAAFLARCRCQLGTEAGGDYFELTDSTRLAVNSLLQARPDVTFEEVFATFFSDYANPVGGRALSSRVTEAAGTVTVQILMEGRYGGYFEPDVHYIPVRRDLSDVDVALDKLRDEALCRELTENARRVAVESLTYERLIDRFLDALRSRL